MRHVREVLRLRAAGVSGNEIARRLNVAPSTVRLTLRRRAAAGLSWPLPADLTDTALEAQLFTAVGTKQGHRRHSEPDWAAIHRELKRKHVTLQILWDEYIERHPGGYRYSRFCELYRTWASRLCRVIPDYCDFTTGAAFQRQPVSYRREARWTPQNGVAEVGAHCDRFIPTRHPRATADKTNTGRRPSTGRGQRLE